MHLYGSPSGQSGAIGPAQGCIIMARKKEPKINAAQAKLERAEDCFVLAKSQHEQAQRQNEGTSRQIDNAVAQEEIAALQHRYADLLESKAKWIEDLGHSLEADAAKINGKTQQRYRLSSRPLLFQAQFPHRPIAPFSGDAIWSLYGASRMPVQKGRYSLFGESALSTEAAARIVS
jgi:hypothetical protein